jgi:hypothetical protein
MGDESSRVKTTQQPFTVAITVAGYSDSDIVKEIAGIFHSSATAPNASLWVEHVQTEARLADIPSRNSGLGHKISIIAPDHHLCVAPLALIPEAT